MEEKEIYLLAESILVKVKLKASKNDGANFRCQVLEIDGVPVSPKDQEYNEESFGARDLTPNAEEQLDVLRHALENFGIRGKISQVTESYVFGHLKVLKLRKRVGERR